MRDRFLAPLGEPTRLSHSRQIEIEIPAGWASTTLGDAVINEGVATARDGTVAVTDPAGALSITDIRDGVVRVWEIAAPESVTTPHPTRRLPRPPWQEWLSGLDDVLAKEIAELEAEGDDIAAVMAAGVLLVHDYDYSTPPVLRIAALLRGEKPRRRSRDWVDGLDTDALREIESESVTEIRRLRCEAVDAGWRSRRDIPYDIRIERDRWGLVREVLREHGLGCDLEAALNDLDAEITEIEPSDDPDDRLVMAAAFREGWWSAGY